MAAVTQFWSDWSNFLGEILDIIDPKHTKRTKWSEILLLFETPYCTRIALHIVRRLVGLEGYPSLLLGVEELGGPLPFLQPWPSFSLLSEN